MKNVTAVTLAADAGDRCELDNGPRHGPDTARRIDNAALRFTRPDGRVIADHPQLPDVHAISGKCKT